MKSLQVVIPAESATFEELHSKTSVGISISKHYGQVECPFCGSNNILAGPYKGLGAAWAFNPCSHNTGAIAGHGSDTFLFRGE